jgi:CRISPR-associated protein Cmr1
MLDIEGLKKVSSMDKYIFNVMTLTPLLMHGWQKRVGNSNRGEFRVAELRAASIKGILRYWWRTLQVDIEPPQLLQEEQAFFGGSSLGEENTCQSPLLLKCDCLQAAQKVAVCPHKGGRFTSPAIPSNISFSIELAVKLKDQDKLSEYVNYMKYCLLLAGFGQRARRGAGALQYEEFQWNTVDDFRKTLQQSLFLLKKAEDFDFNSVNRHCIIKRINGNSRHPRILSVWIGKSYSTAEKVRYALSNAGHIANSGKDSQLLGKAKGGRQASPLIGTVKKIGDEYYPLVTEVSSLSMENRNYQEKRNCFLSNVGVSI